MTTQPSSRKLIEEFYGFPKRPSVTDTILSLTKPIIKKREVDAGLTKREMEKRS
jgi:hypothetical protein